MTTTPLRRLRLLVLLLASVSAVAGDSPGVEREETTPESQGAIQPSQRLNYHTAPESSEPLMKDQHHYAIPSPLILDDGTKVGAPGEWDQKRRPELLGHWTKILGKLSPSKEDEKWFGDIGKDVRMVGEKIWVKLNGETVIDGAKKGNYWKEFKDPPPKQGPIVLQSHGSERWFRNLFIRRLDEGK